VQGRVEEHLLRQAEEAKRKREERARQQQLSEAGRRQRGGVEAWGEAQEYAPPSLVAAFCVRASTTA